MSEKVIAAKQEVVNEIKEKIENAQSVTLVEFDKMDVLEITNLRNRFREANSEYKVYKNTMMRFAFEELGFNDIVGELKGSNALIFSNEDLVNGPKIAVEYRKEKDANDDKLVIKAGVVEGNFQTGEQMIAIATLPAKEILYGMLANVLQAPIRTLAGDLDNAIAKIAIALDQVRAKREENGEVVEEKPDTDPSNSPVPDDLNTTKEANEGVDEELKDANSDEELPTDAKELKEEDSTKDAE